MKTKIVKINGLYYIKKRRFFFWWDLVNDHGLGWKSKGLSFTKGLESKELAQRIINKYYEKN